MTSDTSHNITDLFTDLIAELSQNISDEARADAVIALLDFISCAVQGSKQASGVMRNFPTADTFKSAIIGLEGCRTLAEQAAYINAFNAHSTELDDGYKAGMTHIGAVVVSAILALAQEQGIDIEQVLEAIVIGYEVTSRLSKAINPEHKKKGFHTTGTCGVIGAAVACTCMLGGHRQAIKAAISCAATSSAGLLEIQEQASQLKAVNAAHAASTAVTCARIAMSHLDAPDDILGGPRGFVALLTGGINEQNLLSPAPDFEISHRYMKLYPACRHCHPAIESTLQASRGLKADDISKITVRTYSLAIKGHDHKEVKGMSSAKLSIPFCVALAASAQTFGQEQLDACDLHDRDLLRLIESTEIKEDPELTAHQVTQRAAITEITTSDGQLHKAEVRYAKGDPENPLTIEEIRQKYTEAIKGTPLNTDIFDKLMQIYHKYERNS